MIFLVFLFWTFLLVIASFVVVTTAYDFFRDMTCMRPTLVFTMPFTPFSNLFIV